MDAADIDVAGRRVIGDALGPELGVGELVDDLGCGLGGAVSEQSLRQILNLRQVDDISLGLVRGEIRGCSEADGLFQVGAAGFGVTQPCGGPGDVEQDRG